MLPLTALTIPDWAIVVASAVLSLSGFLGGLVGAAYRRGRQEAAVTSRIDRLDTSIANLATSVDARLTGIARSVAQLDDRMDDVSKTLADHHARLRVLEERTRAA